MTPTAFDYHSVSYGAHAQCTAFDTVRITSIRRTNRLFSVKLANNREEGVIYRIEKLASSHFTYITHYGQRKSEQQEIAIKQAMDSALDFSPKGRGFESHLGYVKSLVYADKPQTLDHLEDNIRRVIADIRPQMLEKVIDNWTSSLEYIRASLDSPMPEIIFKM
ncbi:hypothetical protein TNCV_3809091 [Trichonephila clavipes]|nr:hypothetical protein TNCV_3809091 [Trichonephila clavipes]